MMAGALVVILNYKDKGHSLELQRAEPEELWVAED